MTIESIPQPPADSSSSPADAPRFRRELAQLLNSYSIDAYAEIPDRILADTLADMIEPLRRSRIATARWMDQPLLGEKLALRAEWDGVR